MAHAWADLTAQLQDALPKANKLASSDGQLNALTTTNAVKETTTFGIKAAGSDNTITATINNGKCEIGTGKASDCAFVLSALPEQWSEFFKQTPVAPYQSYWSVNQKVQGCRLLPADLHVLELLSSTRPDLHSLKHLLTFYPSVLGACSA